MYFKWPKNSIRGLKNVISGQFPVKLSLKKIRKIFIALKDSSLNFRGLLGNFCVIVLIFAVISILEDFGSLLPARPVAVKSR